ncbi:uncharacterized protein LOC143208214 [Lasioglossum baleicum]|uniref:uncharacterized protein LOC143208214 n=1 Tax=Lasioglossum baleicum TaxID=434251 RepID=UPI003FCD4B47
MWDLGYRSIAALASVSSGCVFLYNVWGPILLLTILLFLTIYACYSLIINDSSLAPHASFLFDYCVRVFLEVRTHFESIAGQIYRWLRTFWETASRRFFEIYLTKFRMDRRRGTHYQLSADPYPTRRNSSKFDPITQLSPISRNLRESNANELVRPKSYARNSLTKLTSTPIFSQNNEEFENQSSDETPSHSGISPMYSRYRDLSHGEEGSPWGTTISPKARVTTDKPSLSPGRPLSSARYNIDAKVYQDVTSPGLAGRLTKYAAEASNRLTHQSQYQVGQFPKVNLQGSPVPLINAKCIKTKTPVIVRVAPPDAVRYSPSGKQKILSNMCGLDDSLDLESVPYGFREMPLKRHAEREEIAFDLAKKQRTGGIPANEIETLDETKQKRSRDESSRSEEDISPQNKTVRPAKRTKTPSCYDILHSLSSSRNLVSGIKRKARDFSRSGTPDFEKHFKSLESVANSSAQTSPNPGTEITNGKYRDHNEAKASEKLHPNARNSFDRIEGKLSPLKGILKPSSKTVETDSRDTGRIDANQGKRYNGESRIAESKLTNKLFMRAEPERNEKLRMLVEEQGNIRAKFTTDDVEEIKKEDIADMRQTSMKARLQSMFDAISGKATSKINPDVVIQAEEVNTAKSAPSSSASCATLKSSTTTTNANTTPISTSAIALGPGTKSPKHVAFDLPKKETLLDSNTSNGNIPVLNPTSSPVLTGSSEVAFTNAPGNAILPSTATSLNSTMGNSKVHGFNVGSTTTTNNLVPSSGTFTLAGGDLSNHRASTISAPLTVPRTTPSASHSIGDTTSGTMFSSIPTSIPASIPASIPTSIPASIPASILASSSSLDVKTKTNELLAPQKIPSMSNTTSGTSKPAFPLSLPSGWSAATSIGSNALENKGPNVLTRGIPATTSSVTPATAVLTPMFGFENKSSTSPLPLKSEASFAFGSSFGGNTSASVPAFASPSQNNQGVSDAIKPAAASTASSTNQAPSLSNPIATMSATTSAFDSSMKAKTTTPLFQSTGLPNFSFGTVSSGASGNGNSNKPGFSFGNITSTTAATNVPTGTSNTMVFGSGNNNLNKPTFGTAATNSSNVGNSSQFNTNAVSIFRNAATTSAGSVFGTTPGQSIFGASSTASTTVASSSSTTAPPSLFGSHPAATSANSTTIFSNTTVSGASSGIANTSSTSIFGSVAKPPSSGETGSIGNNVFSNTNPTSAFGTPGNIFGQTKPLSENLKSTTGTFASTTTPIFGIPSTTAATLSSTTSISSNPTTSIFGATIVSKNTTAPAFAATNVTSPVFGSHSNTASDGQNPMLHAFVGTANIFGAAPSASASTPASASLSASAAPPIFGSPAALSTSVPAATSSSAPRSTVICNSTPNTFAGQSAASSTFATPANASGPALGSTVAFGQNKTPTFGQASPFATPNVSTTVFGSGSTSNANNNAAGGFTFGANQKPPQQPAASFSFNGSGNNSNNNAAPTASKPGTTGFNFSAPSTTPAINFGTTNAPTFNASMPGMFSIGSGSTAPRSRSVRTRKPR